jgi:monoamine oxidase
MLGLPAGIILPGFLSSCKDDLVPGEVNFKGKVLIIGAGAAGIYAAALLEEYNIDYEIIEAAPIAGGRIRAQSTFSDIPIELGAEEIHGSRSVLYDLASHFAASKLRKDNLTDYYLFNNQLRTETYLRESVDLAGEGETLFQLLESLGTYPGSNQTVNEYLAEFPIDSRLFEIANALIGNEYGSDNDTIGMLALREAELNYSSGDESYKWITGTYWNLFESAFQSSINKVVYNQEVKTIDYSGPSVIATTASGTTYSADKVLLTVPLGVLKAGDISFIPSLSAAKQSAIDNIGFGNVLKIFLKFSSRFWAEDTSSIIGGTRVPEYWVTHAGKDSTQHVLTAFVAGFRAQYLQQLNEADAINTLISELNSLFPSGGVIAKFSGEYLIKDWSTEPFTKGAYSFPGINSAGQRENLAETVSGKLYFAGEAANVNGHIGTVHGAMESSYISVSQILAS